MNLQSEKSKLMAWLKDLEDEAIIEKIKWLKENQTAATDWWNEITKAEQASIDRGLEDLKRGRITPNEAVRKKYEKWL